MLTTSELIGHAITQLITSLCRVNFINSPLSVTGNTSWKFQSTFYIPATANKTPSYFIHPCEHRVSTDPPARYHGGGRNAQLTVDAVSGRTNETRGGTFARLFVLSLARLLVRSDQGWERVWRGANRGSGGGGGDGGERMHCPRSAGQRTTAYTHARARRSERLAGRLAGYVRFLRVPVSRDTSGGMLVLLTCARSRVHARTHAYAYRAAKRLFEAVDAANLIDVAVAFTKASANVDFADFVAIFSA